MIATLANQNLDNCDNGPCQVYLFRNGVDDFELLLNCHRYREGRRLEGGGDQ
jgi:hypothetical protein